MLAVDLNGRRYLFLCFLLVPAGEISAELYIIEIQRLN